MRIESIRMEKFRGATTESEIQLDATKRLILIFGENGTGKSTIVDAIDCACNGNAGSIAEISGAKVSQHLHSLGADPSDTSVTVTCSNGAICARPRGNRIVADSALDGLSATILRRGKVFSLTTAVPSKRFEELKRFIDVANIERCEDSLGKATREVKKELEQRANECVTASEALDRAHMEDATEEERRLSPETWARERTKEDDSQLQASVSALVDCVRLIEQAELLQERRNERQAELNAKRQEREKAHAELQKTIVSDDGFIVNLVTILEDSIEYVQNKPDLKACPVCEQGVTAPKLLTDLKRRLQEVEGVRAASEQFTSADRAVTSLVETTGKAYTDLVERLHTLLDKLKSIDGKTLSDAGIDISSYPNIAAWAGKLSKPNIDEARKLMEALLNAKCVLEKRRDAGQTHLAQKKWIQRSLETLSEARTASERLQAMLDYLGALLEAVQRERKAYVTGVLEEVADKCDRLYQKIHPGEDIGAVRFALDEEKRRSVNMAGTFCGTDDLPPQAYFSESHLDTLGFCFFMALTKYVSKGDTVVVLDDVFMSVDIHHIKRILDVLLEESEFYPQIVFTTHQRHWYDLLKTNQAPRHQVHVIHLSKWKRLAGVKTYDPPEVSASR